MDVKDLLDNEELDPKKFFDEKEYVTILVNREGYSKKEMDAADLLQTIAESELSREEQEAIFTKLKDANAAKIMVEAIRQTDAEAPKARLIAACWESGLDFTNYFTFFAGLVGSPDFSIALEALTVVESIDGPVAEKDLNEALVKAEEAKGDKDLLGDLIANIKLRAGN